MIIDKEQLTVDNEKSRMSASDVAGMTLGSAREKLNAMGIHIAFIKVTAPPKEKSSLFDDSYRVIRVRPMQDKEVELLICKPL